MQRVDALAFLLSVPTDWVGITTLTYRSWERALTLDSLFPLQLPCLVSPFNMARLYISPWQQQCECVRVCVWGEYHASSSATTRLCDSRHVQMVFVSTLNEVADTERSDPIGHWSFLRGCSGRDIVQAKYSGEFGNLFGSGKIWRSGIS